MEEEEDKLPFDIEEDDEGLFNGMMPVANVYFKFIIGKKRSTLNRLESETGTKLIFPEDENKNSIKIVANKKSSIANVFNRITILMDNVSNLIPYSHFLSIPLNFTSVINRFNQFAKQLVNEMKNEQGWDPSIIANPNHFHMTILMLKLLTPEAVNKVKDILEKKFTTNI